MRALSVGVAAVLMVAGRAWAAPSPETVLLLTAEAPALDDRALVEAVAIYTRDLGYAVAARPGAPAAATEAQLAQVAARIEPSVRLAFWYEVRPGGAIVLYAIANAPSGREHHALRVAGGEGGDRYRTLALKVRALLTGRAAFESHEPAPWPAPSAPSTPSPPPPASTPAAPVPGVFLAVGYRLVVPATEAALLRHALLVEGTVAPWRWLRLGLGVELATQPTRGAASGAATLFDLPLRVRAAAQGRRGRWGGAAAALVSLHVLSVDGVGSDGARGTARRAALGLGVELTGALHLGDRVALEVRLLGEGVVPERRFLLRGQEALVAGGFLFGAGVGLSCALR